MYTEVDVTVDFKSDIIHGITSRCVLISYVPSTIGDVTTTAYICVLCIITQTATLAIFFNATCISFCFIIKRETEFLLNFTNKKKIPIL